MDNDHFDALTRLLAAGSRRRLLRSLSAVALGAHAPLIGHTETEAKKKGKGKRGKDKDKKKKKRERNQDPPPPGQVCAAGRGEVGVECLAPETCGPGGKCPGCCRVDGSCSSFNYLDGECGIGGETCKDCFDTAHTPHCCDGHCAECCDDNDEHCSFKPFCRNEVCVSCRGEEDEVLDCPAPGDPASHTHCCFHQCHECCHDGHCAGNPNGRQCRSSTLTCGGCIPYPGSEDQEDGLCCPEEAICGDVCCLWTAFPSGKVRGACCGGVCYNAADVDHCGPNCERCPDGNQCCGEDGCCDIPCGPGRGTTHATRTGKDCASCPGTPGCIPDSELPRVCTYGTNGTCSPTIYP